MFQRKDGLWVERIDINGKTKQFTSMSPKKLKQKIAAFGFQQEHGPTFEEAAEAWEAFHMDQVSTNTDASYRPHVRRAKEYFSGRYMKDIAPDEVQSFIDWIASQGYAKDTVRRSLVTVNRIFKHCIIQPGSPVRFNPCTAVEIPRGLKKGRREPPAPEQIEKVRPDSMMGLFAFFMLYTGLRNGELLALRWEDIDRESKKIHVNKAVEYIGDNPHIKNSTKTEAGIRDVDLLDVLAEVLPDKNTGYVFGGKEPLRKSVFYREWKKWCASVGLAEEVRTEHRSEGNNHTYVKTSWKPLVTPYQFRHEYASMLEEAGVTEFDAKNALGHSSIVVTKDVYTHIRNRKRASSLAEKMNAYLAGK